MKRLALIVVVAALAVRGFGSSESKAEQGEALMRRAADLSRLDGPGVPPFRLSMDIKLGGLVSGPAEGHYLWITGPQNQWHREISFSGCSEVEVGQGSKVWRERNIEFTPQSAFWIQSLLSNYDHLVLDEHEKVDSVYRRSDLQCVTLRRDGDSRDLCFDRSGTLRQVAYQDEMTAYSYSDYTKFGDKLFPHSLIVSAHGRLVVKATASLTEFDQGLYLGPFEPPPGTVGMSGCMNPTPGRLVKKVEPRYTYLARGQGRHGSVYLTIHIAADGTVRTVRVLGTAGPDLDDAAVAAVREWRYSPFLCGGVPVEGEEGVTVNFSRAQTH